MLNQPVRNRNGSEPNEKPASRGLRWRPRELDRLPVWSVSVGFGPGLLADAQRHWIGQTLGCHDALESGQPEISRTKREGLVGPYGFADGDGTAYFHVHEELDTQHAAEARRLIEGLARERDEDGLAATAEAAFRANWRLLDGL